MRTPNLAIVVIVLCGAAVGFARTTLAPSCNCEPVNPPEARALLKKFAAIGELGSVPSPEVLKAQSKWAWFMTWSGRSVERAKTSYDNPYIPTRGDPIPGQ